jgi:hypothetical protein
MPLPTPGQPPASAAAGAQPTSPPRQEGEGGVKPASRAASEGGAGATPSKGGDDGKAAPGQAPVASGAGMPPGSERTGVIGTSYYVSGGAPFCHQAVKNWVTHDSSRLFAYTCFAVVIELGCTWLLLWLADRPRDCRWVGHI